MFPCEVKTEICVFTFRVLTLLLYLCRMNKLVIKNVGPIRSIDIPLNKINVFIGPQSSGKSTIAKIVSFCSWLEKDVERTESVAMHGVLAELEAFHRMEGFFNDDSSILYIGDNVVFAYNVDEPLDLSGRFEVCNASHYNEKELLLYTIEKTVAPKVCYIPAERSFVSAMPNAKKYADREDNLLSFIEDWLESKRHYPTAKAMELINLGIKYYYNEKMDRDMLVLENGEKVSLTNASSGMQSLVPLLVLLNWCANGIYEEKKPYSPEEMMNIKKLLAEVSKNSGSQDEQKKQLLERMNDIMEGRVYTHTQFIIEEPEQNLFPKTQVDFLYFLLAMVNHGRKHRLVLTTHSPYVLYALNNCLLAHLVEKNMDEDAKEGVDAVKYAINPKHVSVWQIENGHLVNEKGDRDATIQDENGLIRKNYFNNIMRQVMGEFNELLNYYE